MRQMCILEKLNFKISPGSMLPDPPSVGPSEAFEIKIEVARSLFH